MLCGGQSKSFSASVTFVQAQPVPPLVQVLRLRRAAHSRVCVAPAVLNAAGSLFEAARSSLVMGWLACSSAWKDAAYTPFDPPFPPHPHHRRHPSRMTPLQIDRCTSKQEYQGDQLKARVALLPARWQILTASNTCEGVRMCEHALPPWCRTSAQHWCSTAAAAPLCCRGVAQHCCSCTAVLSEGCADLRSVLADCVVRRGRCAAVRVEVEREGVRDPSEVHLRCGSVIVQWRSSDFGQHRIGCVRSTMRGLRCTACWWCERSRGRRGPAHSTCAPPRAVADTKGSGQEKWVLDSAGSPASGLSLLRSAGATVMATVVSRTARRGCCCDCRHGTRLQVRTSSARRHMLRVMGGDFGQWPAQLWPCRGSAMYGQRYILIVVMT